MNEHASDGHDRRGRSRFRRAGLLAAVAETALLAAGCGSGGSSPAAAGATACQKALSYTRCMRSHGVPGFPDPTSQGTFIPTGSSTESRGLRHER